MAPLHALRFPLNLVGLGPGSAPLRVAGLPSTLGTGGGLSLLQVQQGMAEERPGSWFGFGFCGFGQALGSGRGRQVLSPEPLRVPDAGTDICGVSAAWSYTAILSRERPSLSRPALPAPPTLDPAPSGPAHSLPLQAPPPLCPRLLLTRPLPAPLRPRVPASCSTRSSPRPAPSSRPRPPRVPPFAPPPSAGAGLVRLSGSAGGEAEGCRDAWASETLLVVLRDGRGPRPGAELQAWAPGSALRGEPLWTQPVVAEAGREDAAGCGTRAGPLPLLPCARAYLSPRPPLCRPLAPELRARRLALGAEHALLLDQAGQVYSWGGGR